MAGAARTILVAMVLLGAFLTFSLEPLTGRLVTPIFGGTIHVWNVCVMVFQGLFFAAAVYAHSVGRRWPRLHLGLILLAVLFLPLGVQGEVAPMAPTGRVVLTLLQGVGAPFFILATTSIMAQAWWADSKYGSQREPYALFAASNIGSLLALFAYPLIVERYLGLQVQGLAWGGGYVMYAGLVLLAFRFLRPGSEAAASSVMPRHVDRWPVWLALSAIPSALSLGLTNLVASELGSFPLFWVIPLALYLGSFAVAFRDHTTADGVRQFWPDLIVAMLLLGELAIVIEMHLLLYLAFFLLCWIAHEALYRRRPQPEVLTEFYLVVAAGGWLGGICVTVVAPLLFSGYLEFPIALVLLGGVLTWIEGLPEGGWWRRVHIRLSGSRAVLLLAVCSLYVALWSVRGDKGYIEHQRNQYGVFSVAERVTEQGESYRELSNGSTSHGQQYVAGEKSRVPVSYYHPSGSNGVALSLREKPARLAGVGLGAGAMAAYLEPEESVVFYEVNPLSVTLAQRWFSYLDNSEGAVDIRVGDARLLLALEAEQEAYDVLFVDAFAGDGIPTHLLTREAFEIYASRLVTDGLLIIHVSNRYYDLRGVIQAAASQMGWHGAVSFGADLEPDASEPLANSSSSVVLCASQERLKPLLDSGWKGLRDDPVIRPAAEWTDDYLDVLEPFFAMRSYRLERLSRP